MFGGLKLILATLLVRTVSNLHALFLLARREKELLQVRDLFVNMLPGISSMSFAESVLISSTDHTVEPKLV